MYDSGNKYVFEDAVWCQENVYIHILEKSADNYFSLKCSKSKKKKKEVFLG